MKDTESQCNGRNLNLSYSAGDEKRLSQILMALADPVRLQIAAIISSRGSLCSCDLEEPVQKSQPTISHHTKVLAEAGLIVAEKKGKWVWWDINPDAVNFLSDKLATLFGSASEADR